MASLMERADTGMGHIFVLTAGALVWGTKTLLLVSLIPLPQLLSLMDVNKPSKLLPNS